MIIGKFVNGSQFTADLAQALKLDRPVRSIGINARCGSVVVIQVEFVMRAGEAERVIEVVERHGLEINIK